MMLFDAEWLRFRRQRINLIVCAALLALLCAGAWVAGRAAAQHRQFEAARVAAWQQHLDRTQARLAPRAARESLDAAKKAYEFGRGEAPPALRDAPGGLVLAVRQFRRQPFDVQVSIDSRHLDPRRGAPLTNPLLDSFGVPDFAVVMALLVPLAVTALCYGLVHDARELGTWRLIRAQMASPARLVAAGLAVRFLALLAIVWTGSLLAFALDPGASAHACLAWLGASAAYLLLWVLLAGLFNLLPLSSAASALGLLALALLLNVATPSWLARHAERRAPLPALESTVVEVRAIQHEADERIGALLDDWYARHPQQRPAAIGAHTWPVSYVPKTLWQDARIGAAMGRFERARAAQAAQLAPLLWLAPAWPCAAWPTGWPAPIRSSTCTMPRRSNAWKRAGAPWSRPP